MSSNNAIASGATILTANADGLASGLSKANSDLQAWGRSAGGGLRTSLIENVGGIGKGGGLGGIGGAITGVLGKIPGPAMAAGAALAGVGVAAHEVFDTLTDLAATNKAAEVLGVSASQYAGMQKVLERVGVEGADVTTMFAKMGKNILDSSAAADQFATMGIDMGELRGANLADQFKMIAEGFTRIPRGAEQARAALEIFGKSGATLLPILQKGKAGIDELIDGESFEILSDQQYAAAGEAVKAWKAAKKDITGAWDGMVAHASVAFAPVVSFIGKAVSKWMGFMAPVFDWWGRAWGQVGVIAEALFTALGDGLSVVFLGIESLVAGMGVFAEGWPTIQEVVTGVFRTLAVSVGFFWDALKLGMSPFAIAAGYVVEGLGLVVKQFKDTVRSILETIAKIPPVLFPGSLIARAALQDFDTLGNRLEETGKKMQEWGKGAWKNFGKSAEDIGKWFDDLLAPKPKAKKEEPKKDEPPPSLIQAFEPVKFASAIERGSKEAYSIEMRQRYGEFAKPENNVHKDNGKKLDKVSDTLFRIDGKLGDVKNAIANIEGM